MAASNRATPVPGARDLAAELQEALTSDLPVLPNVDLAARRLKSDTAESARGDWFGVVPLPDGRVALVVGDVSGHGIAAAAAMAQLSAVLDEILVESGDLAAAMARIDRLAAREPTLRAATVCVVVLDPRDATIEYATCGHPPPMVVNGLGRARVLRPSGAGPLGTRSPIVVAAESMEREAILLLSTDGRLAARLAAASEPLRAGSRAQSALEHVCDASVDLLTDSAHTPEVMVLAAQLRPTPTEPLSVRMAATVDATRELRRAVSAWLIGLGADRDEVPALELAIGEITANVVEHAYPIDRVGEVRIDAALDRAGVVHVHVADDGAWRPPLAHPPTRGRGLWLAGEMVDELHVTQGDGAPGCEGTVITLHRRLRRGRAQRDAAVGRGGMSKSERAADRAELRMESDGASLRVYGSVDVASATHFAEGLNRVTRGGVHPVSIDLSEVSLLTGAGVRVLFELRDRLRGHGHALTVGAASGTPAHDVLKLSGLTPGPPHGS